MCCFYKLLHTLVFTGSKADKTSGSITETCGNPDASVVGATCGVALTTHLLVEKLFDVLTNNVELRD